MLPLVLAELMMMERQFAEASSLMQWAMDQSLFLGDETVPLSLLTFTKGWAQVEDLRMLFSDQHICLGLWWSFHPCC